MTVTPDEVNAFLRNQYAAAAAKYRCEVTEPGVAVARWCFDAGEDRPGELISGPVQFGLADAALWFATFTLLGLRPMAVTSELSIRFLRAASAADLLARAEILRHGRSGLVGEIRIWADGEPDRLVALATGTYVDVTPP